MAGHPPSAEQNGLSDAHVEKIGTAENQYEIDPVISKRVTRKFDLHILPVSTYTLEKPGLAEVANFDGTVFVWNLVVCLY
jgi:hypothetical protein